MSSFQDSAILNYVVRMVVPMRREFGRSLDVQQFMRDSGYAESVLEEALSSGDERLREYAAYVKRRMAGAREARAPSVPAGSVTDTTPPTARANPAPSVPAAPAPAAPPTEATRREQSEADALRAKMMRKYTGGLR